MFENHLGDCTVSSLAEEIANKHNITHCELGVATEKVSLAVKTAQMEYQQILKQQWEDNYANGNHYFEKY